MEEIVLRLGHDMPFNNISRLYPESTIYRWCNSKVDYLEVDSSDPDEASRIRESLQSFVSGLKSEVLFISPAEDVLTATVACKCSNLNSTVRMAERAGCLWKAPVIYKGGEETLSVFSPENENFRELFESLRKVGSVSIVRKTRLLPNALRDSYTISLSDLFGRLTDKQVRHLAFATASGYFGIPKKTSMETLAAAERISESTLQEHISKAESKVMEALTPYIRLYLSSYARRNNEASS